MCKDCVGEHLSDESVEHRVMQFKNSKLTPYCQIHSTKPCELYCVQCDIPICTQCITSGEHVNHRIIDILDSFNDKKKVIQKDIEEFEKSIYPQYQNISKRTVQLTKDLDEQGKVWKGEIDHIIQILTTYRDEFDSKHMAFLRRQEDKISRKVSKVTEFILDLKELQNSSNVYRVSTYKSRNHEFKRLPTLHKISLLRSSAHEITKEQLHQQFGLLSFELEKSGQREDSTGPVTSPSNWVLYVEPRIITEIDTTFAVCKGLCNVSCQSDEEIWSSGEDSIIRLFNLQGKLLTSIQTKSGKRPSDIAVTKKGHLIYTDPSDRSVNMIQKTKIRKKIRFMEFIPINICCTFFEDLLVMMVKHDYTESKVVRYSSEFKETQSIPDNGKHYSNESLYSPDCSIKYISENRNLDICDADYTAGAVVVVNETGTLRFKYTGLPSTSDASFQPLGITTENQSRILTVDLNNNRIHIIDRDGQFLRYIDNCDLHCPWGLCLDTIDNLFVAENVTGKLKKLQYYTKETAL